jgi:hypothetical protein
LLSLLFVCLLAQPALGASLKPDRTEISIGDEVIVQIAGKPFIAVVTNWSAGAELELLENDSDQARLKGVQAGEATVKVKINGKTYKTEIRVSGSDNRNDSKAKPGVVKNAPTQGKLGQDKLDPAEMQRIGDLLKHYEAQLGGIRELFGRGANESGKPKLGEQSERKLQQISAAFLRDLADMGLGLSDLQKFKDSYKIAGGGGHPLFPGQGAWDDGFLATERALMFGRASLVQQLWLETLQDTFKRNPDAAVLGEIDIGSWVKMQLSGLGFEADIDFSSVSIDPDLNRWIVDRFQDKLSFHLNQRSGQSMLRADALLTAHGQASPDVFIGDWGKTFAELDMLKRSKWKLIKVEKNADGSLVLDANGQPRIRMVEKPGAQLFWEVALRKLEAGQYKDVAPEVDYPKMDLTKEPMLSLEMLRHGIHDIEHGPYSRGQKLIKMLKYAERSYFMSKKAIAGSGFNPYNENNPALARFAEQIIAHKNNPEKVAALLEALAGETITADNVDAVTERLMNQAKLAMHDNAARALAFRLNTVAGIKQDAARQAALDKLWQDLDIELRTFRDSAGQPPEIMRQALELTRDVRDGKLPPAELEARAKELHSLLSDSYKLSDSVIERVMMSDSYLKLKGYLRKLGWVDQAIDNFVEQSRRKYPNGAQVYDAVQQLNQQLNKTSAGSGLMKTMDWADNAFSVYDAYLDSKDASEALWNASLAMGRIGLQEKFPSLQIPLAVYDSLRSGSPKPLGMAVVFVYFPFVGQTYMVSQQLQRADVAIRDAEFYAAMNRILDITEFDTQGRITGFSLRNLIGKEIDSASIPPGNRQAIVDLFTRADSTFFTSPNFRYWASLAPRQDDKFGRYEDKLSKLRRFFAHSEDVRYATTMLEQFKAKADKTPNDGYAGERAAALQKMEDNLNQTIWLAMADMLESAARSVQSPELEARIRKIESDLGLGDADLGKNKGLLAKVRFEIRQNSSFWTGENPYAVGLLFDKYLKAYERVENLRKQIILDTWHAAGADYVAVQIRPMKNLLLGSATAAPRLSGDPVTDVTLAETTLAAHQRRNELMRRELAGALQRPVDDAKDKAHLKQLGQYAFEWEHLLDDCGERSASQCAPEIQAALGVRSRAYKDYLAQLALAGQAVQLEIVGPGELKLGDSASFSARIVKAEDRARANLKLHWSLDGVAAGSAEKYTLKADRARIYTLGLSAVIKDGKAEKKIGETSRSITVTQAEQKTDAKLAPFIAAAVAAHDWKRLVDRLDAEKNSDLKMKNVVAWQANMEALSDALKNLKNARIDWALAWRPYIDALDHIDSVVWDKLMQQVENQRNEVERRCWDGSNPNEDTKERTERCQNEGRKFEASCVGTWPAQHWEEVKLISTTKRELGDAVHLLHSAGFGGYRAWFESVEKLSEKYKLPFPYPKPVTPRLKYNLSCASVAPPAGKKPAAEAAQLKVVVPAPTASVAFGKSVTLNASASGGKPPYRFTWSSGGSGARVAVTPRWAGEWTVSVTATDADGKTGEGSATLQVSPARVKLKGTQPTVFYGSRSTLALPGSEPVAAVDPCKGRKPGNNPFDECAKVEIDPCATPGNPFCVDTSHSGSVNYSGGRAGGGNPPPSNRPAADGRQQQYIANPAQEFAKPPVETGRQIVWQSEPLVTFTPPISSDGKTQITYDRMNEVKLWCQIQEKIEGSFQTVGECDQETVKVIAPKFNLVFSPPEGQGRIGQEINASISSQPGIADSLVDFRWIDPPTSNRTQRASNAREISFKPKDAKPVVLKTLARVPYHGDEIGEISATYTGQIYQIKVTAVEPGTRPMIWDTKKGGLVPVPKGAFVTHERITLRAEIQAAAAPDGLRWSWTVNDGTTLSSTLSQTLTVSRSAPGSINARVEARDADGVVLGGGEISLSVIEVSNAPPASANPTPTLIADHPAPEPGQKVSLRAEVSGGKPPYTYVWQGAIGQAAQAVATPTKIGQHKVSLSVRDSLGKTGSASLMLEVRETPAAMPQSGNPAAAILGTWELDANKWIGKLEITQTIGQSSSGAALAGRMWYDAKQKWETLRDVQFDGRTLSFTRPISSATQRYTGSLAGNKLSGKFSQENSSTLFSWSANLTSKGQPAAGSSDSAQSVAGKWKSSEGELTLNQSGNQITGKYTNDGGEIVGEMRGNVLEGFWIENGSSQRCASPKNGRHHWGRIRWSFEADKFAGNWSYCDSPPPEKGSNWTGERIGQASAPAGSSGKSSGESNKPASSASTTQKPDLQEQVEDIKQSWNELKDLFKN